ncbi:MAG: chloramphenicol acetyltransferase [Bacteroidota bacterium]
MKFIHFDNPHRQKHFALFNGMNHPHFGLSTHLDISVFLARLQSQNLAFTPTIVYLVCRAANAITEFRWRIRGEQVVEHELVHPSFTVPTEASTVFSFCYVDYRPEFSEFVAAYHAAVARMQQNPSMEDEAGRDDYLFLSAVPWVSFTSVQHAMPYHPGDSVPRIVWGKYFREGDRTQLPFSVQAHHAVVDGWHVGQYLQTLQALLDEFDFR